MKSGCINKLLQRLCCISSILIISAEISMSNLNEQYSPGFITSDLQGEYASCGSPISIRFFCSIVLYHESTWAEEFVPNAQPFSRKIDSKFIKLFIYLFVRTFFEKRVVAQGLSAWLPRKRLRFGSRWLPFFNVI